MAYGMGLMVQGGAEGARRFQDYQEEKEDRGYELKRREREDTLFEQGQQDRSYTLARRDFEDARADEQYKIQKRAQDRKLKGQEAIRNWMSTGDIEGLVSYANEFTTQGIEHQMTKDADGGYTATIMRDGNVLSSKKVTEDEIGQYIMRLTASDPWETLKGEQDTAREAKAKEAERRHDILKIWEKAAADGFLDSMPGGKGGKVPEWQKEIEDTAGKLYGGKFENGILVGFGDETKGKKYQIHRDLAEAYYLTGAGSVGRSGNMAERQIELIEQQARETVDQQLDNGEIDEDQYDTRLIEVMNGFADNVIKKLAPKPGAVGLGRSGPGAGEALRELGMGGQPQASAAAESQAAGGRTPTYEEYVQGVYEDGRAQGMTDDQIKRAIDTDGRALYEELFGAGQDDTDIEAAGELLPEEEQALERPTKKTKVTPTPVGYEADTGEEEPQGPQVTPTPIDERSQPRGVKNPQRLFRNESRAYKSGLKAGNKKYAKYVLRRLSDDFINQLTPKQQKQAKSLVRQANKILEGGKKGREPKKQPAADEMNLMRGGGRGL